MTAAEIARLEALMEKVTGTDGWPSLRNADLDENAGDWQERARACLITLEEIKKNALPALLKAAREREELKSIGLFWQTSDGKWHFSEGSVNPWDIHDNGRPIRVAYIGKESSRG